MSVNLWRQHPEPAEPLAHAAALAASAAWGRQRGGGREGGWEPDIEQRRGGQRDLEGDALRGPAKSMRVFLFPDWVFPCSLILSPTPSSGVSAQVSVQRIGAD